MEDMNKGIHIKHNGDLGMTFQGHFRVTSRSQNCRKMIENTHFSSFLGPNPYMIIHKMTMLYIFVIYKYICKF